MIIIIPALWAVKTTFVGHPFLLCLFDLAQHPRRPTQQLPVHPITGSLLGPSPSFPSVDRCIMKSFSAYHVAKSGHSVPRLAWVQQDFLPLLQLHQDLLGKVTAWLLTSRYAPGKCLKCGLRQLACYSTTVLQEIAFYSKDDDFPLPLSKVSSLPILPAPCCCYLKWWQLK